MGLRGRKPATIEKRLKALFYGAAGVGKSTAAIQFPNPYIIDTEGGLDHDQYTRIIEKQNGVVFRSNDFNELLDEVRSLINEKHEYKTLVIDPLTHIYADLVDKSALKRITEKDPDGTSFGGHYNEANKKINHLIRLLNRLDMNVIITSHMKPIIEKNGKEFIIVGQTFDCYKKLDYLFDLVFEIQKRGKDRVAVVKKTRIETFPDGDVFKFSYDEVSKRYGKNILEKNSVSEELATKEQVSELRRLVDLLKVNEETVQRWLYKANSETIDEMTNETIQKCIDRLQTKIKGE